MDSDKTPTEDLDPTEPLEQGPAPPQRIGNYRILQKLGEGGMGIVYLAEQERPIRRRVALKIIKLGMDTKAVIARFEAERQALALMNHPNVAKVFDAGTTEQGRPYFVMEYVKGVPITTHCDRQRLTTKERLEIFTQVCEGVQHAHQKAIIHRDLKPSNVLVTIHDEKSVPKIIDFGVAKAIEHRLTEHTLFTELGQIVGTPEYMSPEQAEMTNQDIDTRTDVYSLGVILYELLVGVLPFDPQELRRAGFEEIHRRIREDEPSKPSTRISRHGDASMDSARNRHTDPTSLARQLRGDLDWITMRALEKDRIRRYAAASELSKDIDRHLRDEPVTAGPPSTIYRAMKLFRRHKAAFFSVLSVALALAGGLVATTAMYIGSERARARGEWQSYLANIASAGFYLEEGDTPEAKNRLVACPPSHRGWEWEHLSLRADSSIATFSAHESEVIEVASRSGIVMSASQERIQIWDPQTLRPQNSIRPEVPILAAALSPDGNTIAAVVNNGIRLWDRASGGQIAAIYAVEGEPYKSVAFSPDGMRLVAGSASERSVWGPETKQGREVLITLGMELNARIWDARSGQLRLTLRHETDAHHAETTGQVGDVAFGPNGSTIATTTGTGLRIWDAVSGKTLQTVRETGGRIAFSSDGTSLATCMREKGCRVYESSSGRFSLRMVIPEFRATVMAFDESTTRLIVGNGRQVQMWDITSGNLLFELSGHDTAVSAIGLGSDGSRIWSGVADGSVRVWDPWRSHSSVIENVTRFTSTAVSPDGKMIAAGSSYLDDALGGADCTHAVWVWDAISGERLQRLCGDGGEVQNLDFSPDGSRIVAATRTAAEVWDVARRERLHTLGHPSDYAYVYASFDPDGKTIATGASDGIVRLWDAESGRLIRELAGHEYGVTALAFSPDGQSLVSASRDRTIQIRNLSTDDSRAIVVGTDSHASSVSYSRDGRLIVSGDADGRIRIRDPWSGTLLRTLAGHQDGVTSVGLSPDDSRIVSASVAGVLKIWDLTRGDCLLTLRGEDDSDSATFSPDGFSIVSTGGSLKIWRTRIPFVPDQRN